MEIIGTLTTAAGLFAGTNIDDMIVLAVLNVTSRAEGRPKAWEIWAGQYAGIAILVVISLLAALGLAYILPESYTWLLGFIPIILGLKKLIDAIRARRSGEQPSPAVARGLAGVVAITVANGGDNIAAWTPFFRTLGLVDLSITMSVFAVAVAVWCLLGAWLVSHWRITDLIQRWGHWIVPVVFILIGLYIFQKGGVLGF